MRIIKAALLAAALSGIALPALAATYSAPATLTNGSFYTFSDGQVAQGASSFNDTYNFAIGSGVTGVNFLFNLAFPGSSSTTFGVTVGSDGSLSGLTGGNVTSVVSTTDEDGETLNFTILDKAQFSWKVSDFTGIGAKSVSVTGAFASSFANTQNYSLTVSAVPEPGTSAMLMAGLAMLAGVARRRSQSK